MTTKIIEYRHRLHQIPELDCQLPETIKYVLSILTPLDGTISCPTEGSVCIFFDAGKSETVAFRADMDALPVTEPAGLPYISQHPGQMHACGHDGHTAIALGLAEYASIHRSELPRNVLILFQPAEETTGGAKAICDSGILNQYHVSRIFGLHLWPGLSAGSIFTCPGPLMARSNEVTVKITGQSVHLSRASEGRDALAAGIAYYQRANTMIASLPPEERRVLGFGKFNSGTVRNAVSGQTVLEGSLRTYREKIYHVCRENLEQIGVEIAADTGCIIDVHLSEGYPAVWNHEALYTEICHDLGPDAPLFIPEPVLASEDFSFYQKTVPGVFFFLGIGDVPELHAPEFHFDDEKILPKGLAFLERLMRL